MLTKFALVLVFAFVALVQALPFPYHGASLRIFEFSSLFHLTAPPYPRLGDAPIRDPRTIDSDNENPIIAPGIKISRRQEGCHIDGNQLSGSCRWSQDRKTIIFDRSVPTPAKRDGVTWHVTPDGDSVVFDGLVSISAKRDECSVTADGRVVGDCHMTPDGKVAFNNAVSIAAKRDGPRKSEIPGLDCYLRGSDPPLSSPVVRPRRRILQGRTGPLEHRDW